MNGCRNIFRANGNQEKPEGAILPSDKTDLNRKAVTRGSKAHYIIIKGSIPQEDMMMFVNICAPNKGELMYVKPILKGPKGETE